MSLVPAATSILINKTLVNSKGVNGMIIHAFSFAQTGAPFSVCTYGCGMFCSFFGNRHFVYWAEFVSPNVKYYRGEDCVRGKSRASPLLGFALLSPTYKLVQLMIGR